MLIKNTYCKTVMKEPQIVVMEEFIDNVKVLINALEYKVLEPVSKPTSLSEENANNENGKKNRFYLERNIKNIGKVEAVGMRTAEGFVVLQGSKISPIYDDTIPVTLKEQHNKANIVDNILQEDILFSSPSYAAVFVIGKSANGLISWKSDDGYTLRDIENSQINEQ